MKYIALAVILSITSGSTKEHINLYPYDPCMLYMETWIPSRYPLYVSINIPAPVGSVMGYQSLRRRRSARWPTDPTKHLGQPMGRTPGDDLGIWDFQSDPDPVIQPDWRIQALKEEVMVKPEAPGFAASFGHLCYAKWVCLKIGNTPLYPMVLLIIIPSWKMASYHWEY